MSATTPTTAPVRPIASRVVAERPTSATVIGATHAATALSGSHSGARYHDRLRHQSHPLEYAPAAMAHATTTPTAHAKAHGCLRATAGTRRITATSGANAN